eukprot:2493388-Amphidinium_carterae.1
MTDGRFDIQKVGAYTGLRHIIRALEQPRLPHRSTHEISRENPLIHLLSLSVVARVGYHHGMSRAGSGEWAW